MSIQKVKLYGLLAEKFGDELPIKGDTPTYIIQIMEANFPGQVYKEISIGEYFIWSENEDGNKRGYETEEDLITATSDTVLHIMPRLEGASNQKGGIMAIVGVVVIGVVIAASGGAALGALPALQGALASGGLASTAAQIGIGLALSGIGSMLVKPPAFNVDNDPQDSHQSYILTGAVNTMNEGGAIPVIYGAPIVGSTVISGGIDIEQIAVEE